MRLRGFMHPGITCDAGTSLADAAREMERTNVGSIVVVTGRRISGIVTDRDLAVRGLGREMASTTPVEEVMTKQVVSMRDTADVFDAAAEMSHSGCRRLPVVDAKGDLQGIVTLDDLTILFAHEADFLAQTVASGSTATRTT